MQGSSGLQMGCVAAACAGSPFTVVGVVHGVEVVKGIVGVFTANEPVVAVRAHTLPYMQAIGKQAPLTRAEDPLMGKLGSEPAVQRYTFGDWFFVLPEMSLHDEVIVAFGTRTVLRLPLWRASNAQLDFNTLGTVSVPLGQLLQSSQPVEIAVPIKSDLQLLQHVARASLTFMAGDPHLVDGLSGSNPSDGHPAVVAALRPARVESSDIDEVRAKLSRKEVVDGEEFLKEFKPQKFHVV